LVGYSFVRRDSPNLASQESGLSEADDPALSDIFDAINTLELEYQLGRMPQEDFQTQFQAYRIQAATVLRDQLEAGRGDPTWVLEQEILLARDTLERSSSRVILCPDCSATVPEGTANCRQCGAEMEPQS